VPTASSPSPSPRRLSALSTSARSAGSSI
jgi:hypothetical protein